MIFNFLQLFSALDAESAKYISVGLAFLTLFGVSLGQGYLLGKAVSALARNPALSKNPRFLTILGGGLFIIELEAIYVLLYAAKVVFLS